MKNNVITILVDSVFSGCIGKNRTNASSTPFIDSLVSDSLVSKNVYSYGPYTDAATKGLYCGNKTLDDYGYYFGINSSDYNHYRVFKENNYETVGIYYPYYLISSKTHQYIDHSIYNSGFIFGSVWFGKLKHYSTRKKSGELSEIDYRVIEKFMVMLFDCWILFYSDVKDGRSRYIVDRIKDHSFDGFEILKKEKKIFEDDPKSYIDSVLESGMNHTLAKINDYDSDKIVLRDFVKKEFKKYRKFHRQIQRIELRNNIKDTTKVLKLLIQSLSNDDRDGLGIRLFENWIMSMFGNFFVKYSSGKKMWQTEASMMNQLYAALDFIDHRDPSDERPFYISIHAEEPHNRLAYFTYDLPDEELVEEEISYLQTLVDNVGEDFKGHLIYQLSLGYIDLCVKRLFSELNKRGLLTNTTIMLTADHGSSYSLNPLRKSMVNNFFVENYRTPLLIWNSDTSQPWKKHYLGKYQGENVFPTLCDIIGIKKPDLWIGKSILDNPDGIEYVITEYMGPGCPDMINRDVWMSVQNNKYIVAIRAKINCTIDKTDIVEIYDVESDPYQLVNLVKRDYDKSEVLSLLRILGDRLDEISSSSNSIISNINTFRVI